MIKTRSLARNMALMTAVSVLYFMSRGVVGPISSLYAASLGASYVAIGLLGTVGALTAIVFSAVWGRASDRLGSRKLILVPGLALQAVAAGLVAIASGYAILFPFYVLAAIAQAAYSSSSLALVGDLLEGHESSGGRRMGTYRGLCSLGFGVLAFFSGTIAEQLSMRATYLISAGLLGVGFLVASLVSEQRARSQDRVSLEGSRAVAEDGADEARPHRVPGRRARWREVTNWVDSVSGLFGSSHGTGLPLVPLLVAAFLWSLVTGAVYSLWANYMVQELSYTSGQMSRLWALASLSELPLMILAGWLSDRIGRLPMLSLGFVAWTLVFVGYIFTPQMPWIIAVQLVRGFAYSAFTATAMIYAAEVRQKAQRGQVSGLYASAGGLGSILGMAMGGSLVQVGGFRLMIGVNAALIFGGAVYLAVVGARVRRQALPQG